MPLKRFIKHDFYTKIIVWKLTESQQKILFDLHLNEQELIYFNQLLPKKALEYLGVKMCLKELSIDSPIYHNQKGKPFLENHQFISISHSQKMVCVALSNQPVGIDIEINRPEKTQNIQSKFIRTDEWDWILKQVNKVEYLQIIWGIKESLYKLDGGNLYNFLLHYKVNEFDLRQNNPINCEIIENNQQRFFTAYYQKIEAYFLVWTVNKI